MTRRATRDPTPAPTLRRGRQREARSRPRLRFHTPTRCGCADPLEPRHSPTKSVRFAISFDPHRPATVEGRRVARAMAHCE